MRSALLLALVACGASPLAVDAPVADAPVVETHALGMPDVSMLFPLPTALDAPVLLRITDGAPLVNPGVFAAVVQPGGDIGPKSGASFAYGDCHVVALRFDPCDGNMIGRCADLSDGRLRLVLQPLYATPAGIAAQDIAIHAFYAIPRAELAGVVRELRTLARLQDAPANAPLGVSTMAGNGAYMARLRALVLRYASADRLLRLTVIGQSSESAAFDWIFRGLDRPAPTAVFATLQIPQLGKGKQTAQLAGGNVIYTTEPLADVPGGLGLALNGTLFSAASPPDQRTAVVALVQVQNPALHDAVDTQCVSCHVSTYLTGARAAQLGIDPTSLLDHYATARNVAVASIANTDERTVRAFGWEATFPAISQRVANDTAQVLDTIDARFPP